MEISQLIWFAISFLCLLATGVFINNFKDHRQGRNHKKALMSLSIVFYVLGILLFPSKMYYGARWLLTPLGLLMLAGSAYLIYNGIRWNIFNQLEDVRVRLKIQGIYRYVRNPLYLGGLLAIAAFVVLFRSLNGLIMLPFYTTAIILLIVMEEHNFQDLLGETYTEYKQKVPQLVNARPRKLIPETEILKLPFRNLVFKGGGIKGCAYIGALEVLNEKGVLDQIVRVAGTSAGAITATLVSFKKDYAETMKLLNSLDFSMVPQARNGSEMLEEKNLLRKSLNSLTEDINCTNRLVKNFGWYSSDYFYTWLKNTIAEQCDGNGLATFADFRRRGFCDLYIMAANATMHRAEMFCADRTPDVAVADAVRLSMSIPLFFEALQFDGRQFGLGDYYMDGGIYDNFPIKYFDREDFLAESRWVNGGVNWETLGCYLYTPPDCENNQREYRNLVGYIENLLVDLAMESREQLFLRDVLEKKRTIMINDCCVLPTEFDLAKDKERYDKLVNSGKKASQEFLEDYRLPF